MGCLHHSIIAWRNIKWGGMVKVIGTKLVFTAGGSLQR